MPKTKFQSVVFTCLMAFCMVYCMTVYTVALKFGGLEYSVFVISIKEMWLEFIIVFCLIFFVITNNAKKLAFRIVDPSKARPIEITLPMQCMTVCQIVPLITLIATFIHNGFSANWFCSWIELIVTCFPMALCLQVFYIGPLVRLIFRNLFKKQLGN